MPETGLVRKATLLQVLGISGPTLWRWIRAGRFPQPDHRPSQRLSLWRAETVRRWLSEPNSGGSTAEQDAVRWFDLGDAYDPSRVDGTKFSFAVDVIDQWLLAHGWDSCAYNSTTASWVCPRFKRQAGDKSPFVLFDKRSPNDVVVLLETGEQVRCHNPVELLVELAGLYQRRHIGELDRAKMGKAIADYLLYGSVSPRVLAQAKAEVEAARGAARSQ